MKSIKLKVAFDRNWNEWQVRVFVDGKLDEDKTYYALDEEDAKSTYAAMLREYEINGLC